MHFSCKNVAQEWSAEGYQLWMLHESPDDAALAEENGKEFSVKKQSLVQLEFVKSPLTVNPCMVIIRVKIGMNCNFYTGVTL